jgi:multimeric flavodoxin WrbA
MKLLVISGSWRKGGNTASLLKMIESKLSARMAEAAGDLEVDWLNIGDVDISPCRGCRLCFDRGETFCPHKDDLLAVKARLDAADAILCGSPVYVGDLNGSLKNLIDRLAFVCHRPAFYDKVVYLVATTGGSPTGTTLNSMAGAFLSWGAHLVGRRGFTMGARMPEAEAQAAFEKQTRRIAEKIFRALLKDKPAHPGFLSLMMFKTQQVTWSAADPQKADFQYWQSKGWTDPNVTYFMPHRENFLKVGLARLVGGILAKLFG